MKPIKVEKEVKMLLMMARIETNKTSLGIESECYGEIALWSGGPWML